MKITGIEVVVLLVILTCLGLLIVKFFNGEINYKEPMADFIQTYMEE